LRDPVARLQSGAKGRVLGGHRMPGISPAGSPGLHELLSLSPSRRAGAGAAAKRCCPYPGGCCPLPLDAFFVPQAHYLLNIDCDRDEVHFVCTEALDRDWSLVARAFGLPPAPERHRNGAAWCAAGRTTRQKLECGNVHGQAAEKLASKGDEAEAARHNRSRRAMLMSEAEATFVRNCALANDALLHQRLCGLRRTLRT